MPLAHHYNVVKAFASNRANRPLGTIPRADRDWRLIETLRLSEPRAAEDLVASYGGRAHR
jgi:hypothetical protein